MPDSHASILSPKMMSKPCLMEGRGVVVKLSFVQLALQTGCCECQGPGAMFYAAFCANVKKGNGKEGPAQEVMLKGHHENERNQHTLLHGRKHIPP